MSDFEIKNVRIAEIRIGDRHRKDLGDRKALAASIKRRLLQPIGVTPGMELIWGYRRLLACRDVLGWEAVPARIVQVSSIAQGEFDENVIRKDYTVSERVALIETLRGYGHGGDRRSDQHRKCDVDRLTVVQAARLLGDTKDDYDRAKQVVEAASRDPEKYGRLVDRMDKTNQIAGAYQELMRSREDDRIRDEPQPLPEGPFRVGVIDVPWRYEGRYSLSRRGVTPYPTMGVEEVMALPVPTLMHEDALVWLWATNLHLALGEPARILDRWGFRPVSILTWAKDRLGTGVRLRGQTEHCVLAVKGKVSPPVKAESTLLRAPRPDGHSTKPDEFYALVERLCTGSKVEIFARRERPGWTCWGSQLWGRAEAGGVEAPVRRNGTRRREAPHMHDT